MCRQIDSLGEVDSRKCLEFLFCGHGIPACDAGCKGIEFRHNIASLRFYDFSVDLIFCVFGMLLCILRFNVFSDHS